MLKSSNLSELKIKVNFVKLPAEDVSEGKYQHLNFQPVFQLNIFVGANVSMVDISKLRSLQNQLEEKTHLLSMTLNRQDDVRFQKRLEV
tara:strand:+ start:17443 stop:17709 length:267 start_codon:yes stop_codon:yes gene_type:complete